MNEQSLYSIRKLESTIDFTHANTSDSKLPESLDLRAIVPWCEVRRIAKHTSSILIKNRIVPANIDDYNRLLTYCAVRHNNLGHDNHALMNLVTRLNGYDLSYWAMYFKRGYLSSNSTERLSKAFLIFFGIGLKG